MKAAPLRALTLWPEWAWAIHALDKRVENRSWRIPRGWVAIHAGAHLGGRPGVPALLEAMRALATMSLRAGWQVSEREGFALHKRGRAVCVPTVATWTTRAILGLAHFDGTLPRGGWSVPGAMANHIDDYIPLPDPLPCGGAQGLWSVPAPYAPWLSYVLANVLATREADSSRQA